MSEPRGNDRLFGGFTFVNNSSDKDGEEVAATHEPDTEAETQPVLYDSNKPRIPPTKTGRASYDDVFGGQKRNQLTFWVASGEVVTNKTHWCCYRLELTQRAGGVRLTNEVHYNRLAEPNADCVVEIQTAGNGGYAVDAGARISFLVDGIPNRKG